MNKKFIRILSAVLSVMMIFACTVTASADAGEDVPPATSEVKVEIRVEGLSKKLAEKDVKVSKLSTLKAAIDAAGFDVTYAEDGTIKSVKGEAEVSTSDWQYAVDGVIKTDKLNALVVEKDIKVILYNATADAVIPSFDAKDVAEAGVVTFNGTDKAGNVAPIKGATVKWETKSGFSTYTTDSKGRILINDLAELYEGDHDVEIMKTNSHDVPEIVRMDDMEVNVPKLGAVEDTSKSIFEEVYDFLYSILKGVIEVWIFYINAIIGFFQGQPMFGPISPIEPIVPVA